MIHVGSDSALAGSAVKASISDVSGIGGKFWENADASLPAVLLRVSAMAGDVERGPTRERREAANAEDNVNESKFDLVCGSCCPNADVSLLSLYLLDNSPRSCSGFVCCLRSLLPLLAAREIVDSRVQGDGGCRRMETDTSTRLRGTRHNVGDCNPL